MSKPIEQGPESIYDFTVKVVYLQVIVSSYLGLGHFFSTCFLFDDQDSGPWIRQLGFFSFLYLSLLQCFRFPPFFFLVVAGCWGKQCESPHLQGQTPISCQCCLQMVDHPPPRPPFISFFLFPWSSLVMLLEIQTREYSVRNLPDDATPWFLCLANLWVAVD